MSVKKLSVKKIKKVKAGHAPVECTWSYAICGGKAGRINYL